MLEREITRGCHKKHGKDRADHMEGRYLPRSFLKRLDLGELLSGRLPLNLGAELSKLGVCISKDGTEDKSDDAEHRADPKSYSCARSHPGGGKPIRVPPVEQSACQNSGDRCRHHENMNANPGCKVTSDLLSAFPRSSNTGNDKE